MSIRISIVDDHPMLITGIRNILEEPDIIILASYEDGKTLMEGLKQQVPDVLLLDIQMPGETGEDLLPQLQELYPDMRIMVLTAFDNIFYIKSTMQLGALGYVLKRADKKTMLEAIRAVYEYKEYIDPALKPILDNAVRASIPYIQKLTLTPREKEVLKLIAEGLSSMEISKKLFLGQHTINNYRLSLLAKLDAPNVAVLIKKAIELRLI